MGLLIISNYPNCQGYKIDTTGPTDRKGIEVSGLWMVAEKWVDAAPAGPSETPDVSPEIAS